jgi:hypothetical protein
MNVPAYKLTHNLDHLDVPNAPDYDADLVDCPDWKWLKSKFWKPEPIETLEPLIFQGIDSIIQTTDYPYTGRRLPIMSKRMLQVLLAVGEFPHQVIPVRIESLSDPSQQYHHLIAVQLLEHLDVFDWVNSVYELDENFPGELDEIEKLVLREPTGGFPPIFRVQKNETLLYVSARARAALEQAEIKGVEFLEL